MDHAHEDCTCQVQIGCIQGRPELHDARLVCKQSCSIGLLCSLITMPPSQAKQTYCIPAGMYGCQLWGSRFVHVGKLFESDVSKRHLRFLKRQIGVSYTTSNWAVLAELGCKPDHFYWVRAVCRFQKRILSSNSGVLLDVARADASLATEGGSGAADVGQLKLRRVWFPSERSAGQG